MTTVEGALNDQLDAAYTLARKVGSKIDKVNPTALER